MSDAAPGVEMAPEGVMRVRGALTFATVGPLIGAGNAALEGHSEARVDLAGVGRADSAGLALLVEWLRTSRARGVRLHFDNVPDQIRAIAATSGIDRHIFES